MLQVDPQQGIILSKLIKIIGQTFCSRFIADMSADDGWRRGSIFFRHTVSSALSKK